MRTFLLLISFVALQLSAQESKLLIGKKHMITFGQPANWAQDTSEEMAFVCRPVTSASAITYMYVLGQDFDISPNIDGWISGNNAFTLQQNPGLVIKDQPISLTNLSKDDYLTGRYKALIYEYATGKKEAILAIECLESIVTVVLSAKDSVEFERLYKDFAKLAATVKIRHASLVEGN